jgi:hypothetical protein
LAKPDDAKPDELTAAVKPSLPSRLSGLPHALAGISDTARTRELIALMVLEQDEHGLIYRYDLEKMAARIREASDAEQDRLFHRLVIAALHWRSHWGPPDPPDPGEIDPAVRLEFEDTEELKAACDALMDAVGARDQQG